MAYCLFFPSVVVGPTFNFPLFLEFLHSREHKNYPKLIGKDMFILLIKIVVFSVSSLLVIPKFNPFWCL